MFYGYIVYMPATKKSIKNILRKTAGDPANTEAKEEQVVEQQPQENVFLSKEVQEPENEYYSLTTYVFNGDEYNYLNDDMLSKNIENALGGEKEAVFKIKLCIFKINDECKEPFLEFFIETKDKEIHFPGSEMSAIIMQDGNANAIFEAECCKFFQQVAGVSDDVAGKTYRGYIEEPEKVLYVFFDATYVDLAANDNHFWGILDEIVNEKHIYDNVIDKDIVNMVHNHEFVAYIKDKNGDRINMPCCLYLCKLNENGEYVNVYYDEGEDNKTTKSLSEKKINHEIFGNCYFFTTDPIQTENVQNIKRFSVFIDNALYVLNINKPIQEIDFNTDDEEEDFEDIKTYKDYTCIYFFEDGIQLWCIKNLSRFVEL